MRLNYRYQPSKVRNYILYLLVPVLSFLSLIRSEDRLVLAQSFPGVYYSAGGWADYNEDNYLDLALTGATSSGSIIINLFINEDGVLNQDLTQNIEAIFGGHLTWVDYTNDGHLDLSLSGFQIINFTGIYVTAFYKWENGLYVPDLDSEINTDINYSGIGDNWVNGGVNGHHWGDYDNDGDLDFVQGGFDNAYSRRLDIFYNDNGILRLDTKQTNLVPIYPAIVQWVDLNRDGYLDLVSIGADETQTLSMRVYMNNSTHILTPSLAWESEIFGVTAGAIAFADYNSDGYDDFALTGLNANDELITYVVANGINTFITTHILQGVYYGKPAWGDYDNDGDLDLLVTGQSSTVGQLGSEPKTILYYQQEGSFAIDQTLSIDSVGLGFTQWGDYDQDGDLDLFLAGLKANQDVVSQVYDNLEGLENANIAPNVPYNLDGYIDQDGWMSNTFYNQAWLSWSAPVDPTNPNGGSTPEQGLRYQIQIGSEEENNEHAISTGHYGVGNIGTINRTVKMIRNIHAGSYRWRVRAIDHGYATSDWSNWDFFDFKGYVYPGDADNNGIVNELDILPIGIYFHELGPQRENISYDWNGSFVEPWNTPAATYADANGDGVIDHLDVVGIGINWSNLHENGIGAYSGISMEYQDLIDQNIDNYIEIYNSLSGSGIAVNRMRDLLETIISREVPLDYSLKQNYPNPFNPITTLRYNLPEDALVNITIYDMMGRVVSNLVSSQQNAGYKSIQWNATNNAGQPVSAGLYLYTIQAGKFRQVRKMVLLK